MNSDIAVRVDPLFAEYDRADSPGCALGIVMDGQLVYARGYGLAVLEHGIPNGPRIAYDIASESKQMTAACIALLVEDGLLRLTDPVSRFVPEVPFHGNQITIEHLIHHTSGIPDYWDRAEAEGLEEDMSDRDASLRYALSYRNPDFEPGHACRYSNTGYVLLAAVIEKVTGMRFSAFLTQAVLAPLGMCDTLVYEDRQMVIPRRASAYVKRPDGHYGMRVFWKYTTYGDGNVYSTVDDLYRWIRNFDENRLGKGRFLEIMHTRGRLRDGTLCKYAFGLDMGQFCPDNWRGEPIFAHGGSNAGFESLILRIPGRRLAVILLCNTRDPGLKPKTLAIADVLLGKG
ncbi:MAG TPA: serine hydrolase domain-containing protein [Phycisphaerae bacterium]|nr:serine hydrolase domain-containing protein [Phycisphaerae bacterium]